MAGYDTCCSVDERTLERLTRFTLHDCCERGDSERLNALLNQAENDEDYNPGMGTQQTLDINTRDNTGCTPLHTAILFRQVNCIRTCLKHKAKLSLKCNATPLLHMVITMGSIAANREFVLETLPLLLSAGVDVISTDDAGRLVQHLIATHGPVAAADLVKAAAGELFNIDAADKQGCTALHAAAESRNEAMLEWLLAGGASASVVDKSGDTPAHAAAKSGWRAGMARLMVPVAAGDAAGQVSVRNAAGLTPEECLAAVVASTPLASSPLSHSMEVDGGSDGGAGALSSQTANTLILTHEVCFHHHTCTPITRELAYFPPENVLRLDVLLNPVYGTLRSADITNRTRLVTGAPPAAMSDVLRVHEYEYVRRVLSKVGEAAPQAGDVSEQGIKLMDSDTAVSRHSWHAALRAAGAVCAAIDSVVAGEHRTAFCAVRPPGHHAGPRGIVTSERDMEGSHGFCLLNNVAVGAAYAMHHYGRSDFSYGKAANSAASPSSSAEQQANGSSGKPLIRRIAIFDFDVHHGNGTEAILRNLAPHEVVETLTMPFARAAVSMMSYRPWLDEADGSNVMFISSHGYGAKRDEDGKPVGVFYPGSGPSTGWDVGTLDRLAADANPNGGNLGSNGTSDKLSAPTPRATASGATAGSNSDEVLGGVPFPASSPLPSVHAAGGGSRREHSGEGSGGAGVAGISAPSTAASSASTAIHLAGLATPRTAAASASASGSSLDSILSSISSVAVPLPPDQPSLQPACTPIPEPLLESSVSQPHLINVAMNHGYGPKAWRRIMTCDVLPRLAAFKPDLILVSAGFDAHKTDTINSGYMRLAEDDYAWITRQLVKIANTSAGGRVVSVLEGGYRVQGRIVSSFGKSVAAHVRALASGYADTWDSGRERQLLVREMQYEQEQAALAAAAKAAALANEAASLAAVSGGLSPGAAKSPKPMRLSSSSSVGSGLSKTALLLASSPSAASATLPVGSPAVSNAAATADASPPSSATAAASPLSPPFSAPAPTVDASSAAESACGGVDFLESGRRSKRRRAAVDYAALDAQMRAEEHVVGGVAADKSADAPAPAAALDGR